VALEGHSAEISVLFHSQQQRVPLLVLAAAAAKSQPIFYFIFCPFYFLPFLFFNKNKKGKSCTRHEACSSNTI
jgi:hypothetical protein